MNAQLLCGWLGTPGWPPDHHILLGVDPGETDGQRIERQCHERMAMLRCFQLSYPEEATEGMNRVAQAFISLTEALARSDSKQASSNGSVCKPATIAATTDTKPLLAAGSKTEIDWRNTPPPIRMTRASEPPPQPVPLATMPLPKPIDIVTHLAQRSTEARRGLGTLPALIDRINLTRRMILAWNQAGKYLNNPKKILARQSEEVDLTRRLNKIFGLSADFPKILGNPGQPGYRVVAMARLEMTALMFKRMDEDQRVDLARDWEAGYRVLLAHRRFLRGEFKTLRRRGVIRLILQAIRGALNDHPIWVSVCALAIVALCAAFYHRVF